MSTYPLDWVVILRTKLKENHGTFYDVCEANRGVQDSLLGALYEGPPNYARPLPSSPEVAGWDILRHLYTKYIPDAT